MIKKLIYLLLILNCLLLCFSCTKTNELTDKDSNECISNEKFYNYYTGEECSKNDNNKSAFMAIIENSPSARPQSGLSFADILYETSAEGGIPRFIALFSSELPSIIGPIRSVRPYFIDIAKEFNIPFAHCGGSDEALSIINNDTSLISINEINKGSYFWRDSSRKAPHNLYTSSENIKKYLSDNNIKIENTIFTSFDESYFNDASYDSAKKINIKVNSTYSTSYEYKDGLYYKFMDSKEAIDAINDKQLHFSNLIIQKTSITLSADNSHLNIPLTGKGDGLLFSQGKVIEVNWIKDSENSKTTLYDKKGNKVSLSPGKTMWNIIDVKNKIEISD